MKLFKNHIIILKVQLCKAYSQQRLSMFLCAGNWQLGYCVNFLGGCSKCLVSYPQAEYQGHTKEVIWLQLSLVNKGVCEGFFFFFFN